MNKAIEPLASSGLHEKVLELALKLPGTTCLDVPTGYGALAEKLLAAGKMVTAGDINIEKFLGTRSHSAMNLVRLDLNEAVLPLPDNHFDLAISIEGIEHLQSQWNLVRNLFRVLKPGGTLIITTPNILNIRSRFRYLMEGRYEHFKRPLVKGKSWVNDLENYHIAPVSFFELQFMLESCGFSIQAVLTNSYTSKNIVTALLKPLFNLFYANKNHRDKKRKRGDHGTLYHTVMSDEVYYGECLIIVAKKEMAKNEGGKAI
jgi:SAM-dependent methyltransferase